MKKTVIFIALAILMCVPQLLFAGDPPPVGGDPTSDPGATPIGGSAPIGTGIVYLVILAALYAIYWIKKMNINLKSIT